MKKLLALLLAVVMILTLVACGSNNNANDDDDDDHKGSIKVPTTTAPEEEDTLVGKWGAKIIVDAEKMDMEGMNAKLEFEINAVFNKDNTYRMEIDEDALKASIDKFVDDVIVSMVDMMYKQFSDQGMTKEQVDSMIQSTYGMSLEEFCQTSLDAVDIDAYFEEAKDKFGTYRVDGDKLYLLEDEKDDADETPEEELYSFQLKGNKLSIASDEGDFKEMLELIGGTKLEFTRK